VTFDIEREKGLRYRIRYHNTISKLFWSISEIQNFNIDLPFRDIRYRWLFDVEHVQYRYTISIEKIIDIDEHSMSKSSIMISNITFDIERPTLDIGVPRIQMSGITIMMMSGG
jgi:hypothetical protein